MIFFPDRRPGIFDLWGVYGRLVDLEYPAFLAELTVLSDVINFFLVRYSPVKMDGSLESIDDVWLILREALRRKFLISSIAVAESPNNPNKV